MSEEYILEKQLSSNQAYFKEIADNYYLTYHKSEIETYQDLEFSRFVSDHGFDFPKILEIGCGTGNLLKFFYDQQIDYVGLDASEEMICYAKKDFPLANLIVGDIYNLPFENESFDIVIVAGTLHHLPNETLESAITEIQRVLVPHGLFYGREPVYSGENQLASISKNISYALMSMMHFIYRKMRTRQITEPSIQSFDAYHTSYKPSYLFEVLSSPTLKIEEFKLKFPFSCFFKRLGTGSKQINLLSLQKPFRRIVESVDQMLQYATPQYGDEIFFRAVKYFYTDKDVRLGLESFIEERQCDPEKLAAYLQAASDEFKRLLAEE
jgi:SAM-dependent methyltransferase